MCTAINYHEVINNSKVVNNYSRPCGGLMQICGGPGLDDCSGCGGALCGLDLGNRKCGGPSCDGVFPASQNASQMAESAKDQLIGLPSRLQESKNKAGLQQPWSLLRLQSLTSLQKVSFWWLPDDLKGEKYVKFTILFILSSMNCLPSAECKYGWKLKTVMKLMKLAALQSS